MFAVFLVVKVLCGKFSIACLRPLTRRYILSDSVNYPYKLNMLYICTILSNITEYIRTQEGLWQQHV
ncbi:hypothetical protein FWP56_22670 [Vibrio vulnificus]|nr:hypothetical protein [Vibrio vulnificus]